MPCMPTPERFPPHDTESIEVAVIGGGPAGLMSAEVLSSRGLSVHVFDAMPSVGRKFLLAGRGGLNLTHAEAAPAFVSRFGAQAQPVGEWLNDFGADQLRAWAQGLGIDTFVGSSGRVFPQEMKAAPLLRAWLHRLRHAAMPVQFHMRHRWQGWSEGALVFDTPQGKRQLKPQATVLALGGASWPRLGSDGAWVATLRDQGVTVNELLPANCGFDIIGQQGQGWSAFFAEKFAGQPFKTVAMRWQDPNGQWHRKQGEFVATQSGVEGSLVYSAARDLRDVLMRDGQATFWLDLLPDKTEQQVQSEVSHPRGSRSLSSHLKSRLGLDGIKMALLHEAMGKADMYNPRLLADAIKAVPVTVCRTRPLAEAISTAGGVALQTMNTQLMLTQLPGVFCAGEMLDWEAPTGGYLLTASMSSGFRAGHAVAEWLSGL